MHHMIKGKKVAAVLLSAVLTMGMLTGCGDAAGSVTASTGLATASGNSSTVKEVSLEEAPQEETMITPSFEVTPTKGSSEEADTSITLGDTISIKGQGATQENGVITITKGGTYEVTGTLTQGQIVVDCQEEEKVTIILNGVSLTNTSGSAILVKSSPKKTVIQLAEDSVNVIADGSNYSDTSDSAPDAAIYSKDDLSFTGSGTLYVTGNYQKGISCKDDLEISDVNLYVKAEDDGIRGKDSLTVKDALVYVNCQGDGLRTSNETDTSKGDITISGSKLYLTTGKDGIQSVKDLTLTDNLMVIQAGGGSENAQVKTQEQPGQPGQGQPGQGQQSQGQQSQGQQDQETETEEDSEETSTKGLKAAGNLTVEDGSYTIDSAEDTIHSDDTVMINGGSFYLEAGDDGIHGDLALVVNDGNIDIVTSYEGIEGASITLNNGSIRVKASDDGLNGSGTDATLAINGGYLVVNADGDGLDCNGSMTMTAGVAVVYGPTNDGNGALDYDEDFTISGGTLLALGSKGMALSATGDGQQVAAVNASVAADTLMSIRDSEGNDLIIVEAPKEYQCIVFSSSDLKTGTYEIYTGGSVEGSQSEGIYQDGTYTPAEKLGDFTIE